MMQCTEYGKVSGAEDIQWAQPKPFHFDFIYEEFLIQLRCFQMSEAEFEEGIDRIIRSRNRVTHGNFANISNEDALIAVNLMNLIYVSRLDRLGVSEEAIRELMKRGVVY